MGKLIDRNWVPERAYAVERALTIRPMSRQTAFETGNARLTSGASLILVLLSSLGLWAVIWTVVASLASAVLP